MSAMLQQPYDLYKPGSYDQYLLGLVNQLAQAMDDSITDEVHNADPNNNSSFVIISHYKNYTTLYFLTYTVH